MLRCFQCWQRPRRLEDKYELLELLGEGKTGLVYRAKARSSGQDVAVKIVRVEYLSTPQRQQAFQMELLVLSHIHHTSIIKCRDVFQDAAQYAIVTDLYHGGELLGLLTQSPTVKLSERMIARIIRELLTALVYLHQRGITHRDVKLENLMCKVRDLRTENNLVLIDFGLAHKGTPGGMNEMTGMNGTVHYMAPEMFGKQSQYGSPVDIWAVGVITFVLLYGAFPFDGAFMSQVEDAIVSGEYAEPSELASVITNDAKKFVKYLLAVRPEDRPPAIMALQHPWLQRHTASAEEFSDIHMARIRAFAALRKPPTTTKQKRYEPPTVVP